MSYSDSPCVGARRLEVEPTRGVSRLSGTERIGNDVRREHFREQLAEAVRPLTGMNAKQFENQGRRMQLAPEAQHECRRLDARIPALEREERLVDGPAARDVELRLFEMRRRFRELGC